MRGLDDGRTYVVTRRSTPVGELRPLHRRRAVDTRVVLAAFAGAPAVNADLLREDLDALADPMVDLG